MRKKYYLELSGGLGNQLFQVAQANYLNQIGFNIVIDPILLISGHNERMVLTQELILSLGLKYRKISKKENNFRF